MKGSQTMQQHLPDGKDVQTLSADQQLVSYALRLGDDRLILGHRLSEWCGHGPILEEDLALGNIALDLIGQAQAFLALAGKIEGQGRSDDALAYFRDERNFFNAKLVELPKGDFAYTMLRQFFFDVFAVLQTEKLQRCTHLELAAIAAKCLKEHTYHLRHTSQWVIRLGDGTDESRARVVAALDELWPFTGELLMSDALDEEIGSSIGAPLARTLKDEWMRKVSEVLTEATLDVPSECWMHSGGREGLHTEHLGILLAEMQSLARTHPGASW